MWPLRCLRILARSLASLSWVEDKRDQTMCLTSAAPCCGDGSLLSHAALWSSEEWGQCMATRHNPTIRDVPWGGGKLLSTPSCPLCHTAHGVAQERKGGEKMGEKLRRLAGGVFFPPAYEKTVCGAQSKQKTSTSLSSESAV